MFHYIDLKPFIENVIQEYYPQNLLKNHSNTLGLSQLVSTIVPSRIANKKNKSKEENMERSMSSRSAILKPAAK